MPVATLLSARGCLSRTPFYRPDYTRFECDWERLAKNLSFLKTSKFVVTQQSPGGKCDIARAQTLRQRSWGAAYEVEMYQAGLYDSFAADSCKAIHQEECRDE